MSIGTLGPPASALTVLRDHALRDLLTNEVHARPHERLQTPLRVTHLAMLSGEGADEAERRHLARLCSRAGAPPPPDEATHHSADLGPFRLKWERHTEFSTWTVFRPDPAGAAFSDTAIAALPVDWLAELPGERLVGIHLALVPRDSTLASPEGLVGAFGTDSFVGSVVSGEAARFWTDFRIHGDGFSRVVLADFHLSPRQAGRTVQRILEIETYRMMALLALPPARSVLPRISGIEAELAALTQRTATAAGHEDEQALLRALTRLAAAAEQIAAETSYRFSAARAYSDLVDRRMSELRESRIEGLQTLGEFMARRLQPAIRTCEAVAGRLEALSARIARASNLLRTRVDLALESQNRDLLQSMDRRAQLQLRLQETVEGLSVVAISYYLLGLVGYAAKGLKAAGAAVDPDIAAAAAIPVVLALVWTGVRRLRRALAGRH
ncbi:DUF3422 family protein [Arenibaculum pallidiluteum]|uniref:DUF3422 family protein n=1 Tax=Arenibaculum pallidiluteum TaxID=2812559 RepID=UPI001A979E33|nr:DUF3422 domain-containing protein [Arenibaculum pallidiluteum]